MTADFAPASSKEFLDIHGTAECGFTLKRVRDMTTTYSQVNKIKVVNLYIEKLKTQHQQAFMNFKNLTGPRGSSLRGIEKGKLSLMMMILVNFRRN